MTEIRPAGQPLVLLCKCVHYDIISRTAREEVSRSLLNCDAEVQMVADLCGLAASRDPRLQEWAQTPSLAIVACFPRAIRWLFHAAGAQLAPERARFFNMRTQSPEEIARELMQDDGSWMIEKKSVSSIANHQSSIIDHQSEWIPWFPVIDYDRCVNCKQCMNFCLFGTYGLSAEGQVRVVKPSGCKTNCPACARMCPRQAIIFPKYPDPPINGGEGQSQEPAPSLAGDVYERLRGRSVGGRRFSPRADDASRSCPTLDSLKRELNVPDDVLASLSPAEVQRIISQSKSRSDSGEKDDDRHE